MREREDRDPCDDRVSDPRRAAPGARAPPGCCPQAAERLDTRRELWPDEVRIRGRAAQPRRRVVPPARAGARRRRRRGPRRGAGDRRRAAARCRTRSPARAACSSASSTRSARSRRSGSRSGDRVATLVSLTLTPLVIDDGLAALGRPQRAGARRRVRRSSSAARSPPCCPTTWPPELALAVMDVCGAPGADRAGRAAVRRRPVGRR